ncbi:MAG TPA: HIT domain-containing protein [Candidatus Peribacterales bacterium]|nr:HIT domain-containing protein [Candidatus Peribacterales bacterium]
MTDCLFCRIIRKELPSTIVHEDSEVIAFKDIHPKAPTHLLFVPKEHIESVLTLTENTKEVPSMLIWKAKEFAAAHGIPGYKLTFHCGREGGQIVDHLHLHLMAEQKV